MKNKESENLKKIDIESHFGLVHSCCQRFRGRGIDYDDLFQEGMIGFNNAINSYNSNSSIFYTYASICIKRNIISYIRNMYSKKNLIFNNVLDDSYFDSFMVFDKDIFLSNMYEYEFTYLKNNLSNNDSLIFELKYNGFSNIEISKLLDFSIGKVNRSIYKIKNNLRKTN